MKILFVASANKSTGVAPFTLSQGESLKKAGVDLEYFLITKKGLKGYLGSVIQLKKKLSEKHYDVIHAHYGLCGWVSKLANLTSRTPLILSLMGSDLTGITTKTFWHSEYLISKINQFFWGIDGIIVKSNNLIQYIAKKHRRKISIIPNGVDFYRFHFIDKHNAKASLGISEDRKIILFLGNKTDPIKNFTLVQEAYKQLGSKDYELLCPFPVKHEQIPLYINSADVLVLASISEGSPNVVKEAMACDCPVVATDVGDVKEVIGKTKGCYISDFDLSDLADKIKKAIEHGKPTTGHHDISHLEERVISKKLIDLYVEIINNKVK